MQLNPALKLIGDSEATLWYFAEYIVHCREYSVGWFEFRHLVHWRLLFAKISHALCKSWSLNLMLSLEFPTKHFGRFLPRDAL